MTTLTMYKLPEEPLNIEVLDSWCTEIGRNPQEIEHTVGAHRSANAAELAVYVNSEATHFILSMSKPWILVLSLN